VPRSFTTTDAPCAPVHARMPWPMPLPAPVTVPSVLRACLSCSPPLVSAPRCRRRPSRTRHSSQRVAAGNVHVASPRCPVVSPAANQPGYRDACFVENACLGIDSEPQAVSATRPGVNYENRPVEGSSAQRMMRGRMRDGPAQHPRWQPKAAARSTTLFARTASSDSRGTYDRH
jgi:hypothetical protein